MDASHTFRGRTMSDAVQKLKLALGADAVIVSTRRGSDHRGRFVEITACGEAVDELPALPPAMGGARGASAAYARNANPNGSFAERAAWLARQMRESQRPAPAKPVASAPASAPAPAPAAPMPVRSRELDVLRAELDALKAEREADAQAAREAEEIAALRQEIAALRGTTQPPEPVEPVALVIDPLEALRCDLTAVRDAVDGLETTPDLGAIEAAVGELRTHLGEIRGLLQREDPSAVSTLRARLVAAGISDAHAHELARHAVRTVPGATCEDGDLLAALGGALAEDLRCTGDLMPRDGQRRVLAFVGPTGVGKTTTIAKVAAHAALVEGIPTALVTVDTFRMAAVEQIARYADILECPLRVVKKPEDLPAVLDELADARLVLVDTTGRNPRAADQVNALARFFPPAWGGDLVLTLAASTRERDLFATVDAFADLNPHALCVTKTDETDAPGTIYTLARRAAKPLAWITNGQRVPEDIELADGARVAARIVAAAAERAGVALAS